MKFTLGKRKDGTVEIHLFEDGSDKETIWICENDQAAIFKLAHLLFSMGETPEQAKRSVLVGEFAKKKPEPERPDLEAIKKLIEQEMEKVEKYPIQPGLGGFIPSTPNYPFIQPYIQPFTNPQPFVIQPSPFTAPGYGDTWIGDPPPGSGMTWVTTTTSTVGTVPANFIVPKDAGEAFSFLSDKPVVIGASSAGCTANTYFTTINCGSGGGVSLV